MFLIAEVKTASPFDRSISCDWNELFNIAVSVGDMISIHTDSRWGGSLDMVREAKKLTNKPILAKGIHAHDEQVYDAFQSGADYVLVVGRIPGNHLERCFIEPNSIAELKELPSHTKAVWNSRDLKTGNSKKETFIQARHAFTGWLCQASNITTLGDVEQSADAILVGTHLPELAVQIKETDNLDC